METLISRDLYTLLAQWAIPTLVLPLFAGALVTFSDRKDIDPVSSGIVRLACVCSSTWGVPDELLSSKTRIIAAATSLAFATAEAIVVRQDKSSLEQD